MVDDDGVACLGGLGSALVPSLAFLVPSFPADWPDVASEKWFPGTAPELVDPGAFGLTQAHTTKTTDIFAFGMLAWEVSQFSACLPILRYLTAGAGSRSLLGSPRSQKISELR